MTKSEQVEDYTRMALCRAARSGELALVVADEEHLAQIFYSTTVGSHERHGKSLGSFDS